MSQAITRHPVCVAQAAPSRNARPSPNHVATAAPLHPLNRRQALLSTSGLAAVAVLVGLPPRGAAAADQLQQTYTDEADKFSLAVPAGWTMGTGDFGKSSMAGTGRQSARFSNNVGMQRVVAWISPEDADVTVSVTVNPSSYEFTKLGSLGSAYDFAGGLVGKMDQSFLLRGRRRPDAPPVQIAKLLDAKDAGDRYLVDYTLGLEGQEPRVVLSAVAIGSNGRQMRFYSVNASCPVSKLERYEATLRAAVASFAAPPPL